MGRGYYGPWDFEVLSIHKIPSHSIPCFISGLGWLNAKLFSVYKLDCSYRSLVAKEVASLTPGTIDHNKEYSVRNINYHVSVIAGRSDMGKWTL